MSSSFLYSIRKTLPQIVYKDGAETVIHNLADWPDPATTPFYRVRRNLFFFWGGEGAAIC